MSMNDVVAITEESAAATQELRNAISIFNI